MGGDRPVVLMGALNVSPESFHAGSVHRDEGALVAAALAMVEAGAALVDVGARATAPYLPTEITEDEEARRLAAAVGALARKLAVPISADTGRPLPARAALDAGATVVNDVSCLRDPAVARLVADRRVGLIVMASPAEREQGAGGVRRPVSSRRSLGATGRWETATRSGVRARGRRTPAPPAPPRPIETVMALLRVALARARDAGIAESRIVVDPGIGFFRHEAVGWPEWDVAVLAGLTALGRLGRPVAVGVSRKSFVGALTGTPDPADRLAGSLAATAVAVLNGAAVIRAHDVAQTRDAVRVAEPLRGARR